MKAPILAAVVLALLLACGNGTSSAGGGTFSCTGKSGPCPNDPPLDAAESMACSDAVSGSCGSQFTAYKQCQFASPSCDANGNTMPDSACNSQAQAYAQCLVGSGPTDAGGGG